MNVKQKPLVELMEEAITILHRALGTADTLRFLRQFSSGFGNYTSERSASENDETLDELIDAIKARRIENKISEETDTPADASYQQRVEQIRQRYPRAYEKWTTEEDTQLRQKYRAGLRVKELAILLKRQPGAVESRLQKLGLTR